MPWRIKRARSAREDSSLYIYIYIYITVVPFPGSRTRRQQIPRVVSGAKSDFSWCPGWGPFFKGFRRLQRSVLGDLFKVSGTFFPGLRAGACPGCEKVFFWSVSWSEEQWSSIAETCKPYSISFKNRRCASDGLVPLNCVPTTLILGIKSLFWRFQTVFESIDIWYIV